MRNRLVALALVSFLAACGGESASEEASMESAAQTQAAATMEGECALPEGFPAETPLVPGCSWTSDPTNIQDEYLIVSAHTSVSQDEAVAFFEEELPAAGWEITMRDARDDGGVSLLASGHDVRLNVEIHAPGGQDALSVQYTVY